VLLTTLLCLHFCEVPLTLLAEILLELFITYFVNRCCLGSERVYQMPIFTHQFCQHFLEEIKHFETDTSLPKGRPNTMNNYGVSKYGHLLLSVCFVTYLNKLYMICN